MTAARMPRSIPISKARRSDSRDATGSIRASSTTRSVSWSFKAKCLIVEMMPRLCAPSIAAPAMRPVSRRVFGEILEIAAAARVADQIRRAAEQDVEAPGPGLGPDRFALPPRQRQVPGRSQREIGRHGRRRVAVPDVSWIGDAELGIGLLQRGDAEPRNPGDVARRPDRALRFRLPPHGAARTPCTSDSFSDCVIRSSAASARVDETPVRSPQGAPAAAAEAASQPAMPRRS